MHTRIVRDEMNYRQGGRPDRRVPFGHDHDARRPSAAWTPRPPPIPATWIARHLDEERRTSSLLGEIREVVFGAQDGLVSTLAVVATVAGAPARVTPSSSPVSPPAWPVSSHGGR